MKLAIDGIKVTILDSNIIGFVNDNLINKIEATTDLDDSWKYSLLVRMVVENKFNIIKLSRNEQGLYVELTKDMLPFDGKYEMQFEYTSGDIVGHTEIFEVWVKHTIEALSAWENTPSEFEQIRKEIKESEDIVKEAEETVLENLKNTVKFFNTVDEMKNSTILELGDFCITLGYYEPNDGGGGSFQIREKTGSDIENLGSLIFISNSTLLAELIVENNTINVKQFGAKGDGVTDDTEPIKSAIMFLEDDSSLYFPKGIFKVSINLGTTLFEITKSNITIFGNLTRIVLTPNDSKEYNIFKIYNANNVFIKGLTIVGDRKQHDYNTISSTHEFGYGIYIHGDNSSYPVNCIVKDCNIYDMTGDAIVTKNGLSGGRILIQDCELHHCRRQGISVLDTDDITINNCYIHDIGKSDGVLGTSPQSGIDIEPASGSFYVNSVSINGCTIKNCTGFTIVSAEAIIDKCGFIDIKNSKIGQLSIAPPCEIINSQIGSKEKGVSYFYVSWYDINNPNILLLNTGILNNCIIYLENEAVTYTNRMNNCTIIGVGEDNTSQVKYSNFIDCIVENCQICQNNNVSYGGAYKNIYKNCRFNILNSKLKPFNFCVYENCEVINGNNFDIQFIKCILDEKYFQNGIYNQCYIASENN